MTITDIFKMLLKKWYIVLILAIAGAVIGFTYSEVALDIKYTSTSQVFVFSMPKTDTEGNSNKATMSDNSATKHFEIVSKSPLVYSDLAVNLKNLDSQIFIDKKVDRNTFSAGALKGALKIVRPDKEMNVLDVTCTWGDAEVAQIILTEYYKVMEIHLANIPADDTIIMKTFIPPTLNLNPIKTDTIVNTLIVGILCAVIGIVLVIMMNFVSDKVESQEQLESELKITVMAEIPSSSVSRKLGGKYGYYSNESYRADKK